ncbi:MAG TPA: response regulator [Blastocatellia bacterium]|jgi:DNA-binding response OmpR family regulator|nr:response regulator [Blastocatellia bacterium]
MATLNVQRRPRILVVEDDDDSRQALARLLELDGFEVITARRGDHGYFKALKHEPDLILTDLQMPGMDGIELSHLIRRQSGPLSEVPIMALSANPQYDQMVRRPGSGVDDFLPKPVSDYEGLVARIKKLLRAGSAQLQFA